MTKLYKVTGPNGEAQNGGRFQYDLPVNGKPGKWHKHEGEVLVCESGFHVVPWEFIWKWIKLHSRIWEVETRGAYDWEPCYEKVAVSKIRLVREVEIPKWWQDTKDFCESVTHTPFMQNNGPVQAHWQVCPTQNAARLAARLVAWDYKWDVTCNTILDIMRDATHYPTIKSGVYIPRHDVRDAIFHELYVGKPVYATQDAQSAAIATLTKDLISSEHYNYIMSRWAVWQAGYGLLTDVGGTFYVYEKVD